MSDSRSRERRVLDAVERRREVVNDALAEELPVRHPDRLWEAARHLLDAGGKRLRPTLMLLVAEALSDAEPMSEDYRSFPDSNGDTVDLLRAAGSVEVIHTFTLIHDDIMDEDPLRRGVAAVHEEYDDATAIIAGDTLFSSAFELLTETGAPAARGLDAINLLAETCTRICEGQSLDIDFETRNDVVPDEYVEMIDHKTAVLYGASAAIPAILLGADEDTVDELYAFGREVGQAFQIHDDVLDLTVPSEKLGKQRGSDLVEGKQTIITVHARDRGVDVEGLVDAETPEEVTGAEIEAAVEELEAAGSIEYAREMAHDLADSGKGRLSVLPENESRELLAGVADYLVERGY
ncbi:phosphoesterase [Halobacteriales archaeon QS_8_69_26]|nr:MAG: phosphoesterase [Halobacteriales archaeon QS_8_69_26]